LRSDADAQRFVRDRAIMESMRESWTDERLDDLSHRVVGFAGLIATQL
jgi:hypothetical protein